MKYTNFDLCNLEFLLHYRGRDKKCLRSPIVKEFQLRRNLENGMKSDRKKRNKKYENEICENEKGLEHILHKIKKLHFFPSYTSYRHNFSFAVVIRTPVVSE